VSAPTGTPVIECVEVARSYPGGIRALDGVSLTVRRGEFLAIVGPSGSGKSTLLNLMGTLDRPDEGSVRIGGTDVASMSDRQLSRFRAERIGFVFQQFHLSSLMDVRDNVAEGLLYAGVPHAERRRRAVEILGRLGLADRLDHHPHTLSGGERQRVAIARALMGEPDVILADEPTGNLDTANGRAIIDTLRGLATEGTAVVVITHDLDLAAAMDRRVEIRDGRIERTVGYVREEVLGHGSAAPR
jgi:putative ABC transport system ATP-binding protein